NDDTETVRQRTGRSSGRRGADYQVCRLQGRLQEDPDSGVLQPPQGRRMVRHAAAVPNAMHIPVYFSQKPAILLPLPTKSQSFYSSDSPTCIPSFSLHSRLPCVPTPLLSNLLTFVCRPYSTLTR